MVRLTELQEAWRMFKRARHVKRHGFLQYAGSPEEICRSIIERAFQTHTFFPASNGHFAEFYVRDFSWCAAALVELGYEKEVRATLEYALQHFEEAGKITTMITPRGEAFDFPEPGPDSIALFLYTIIETGNVDLAESHEQFLQQQVLQFAEQFVTPTGLPKKGEFTSMRDNAKRDRSVYDATMICVVAQACETLSLTFPMTFLAVQDALIDTYWNGTYFFSDMKKQNIVTGDANVIPFWTGVVNDEKMLQQAMTAIRAAGLDTPFPLRYVSSQDKKREDITWHRVQFFMKDYETDSIWAHMAMPYIELLSQVAKNEAVRHLHTYVTLLMTHRTFLEVYAPDGTPYENFWYVADEGMLWCAPFLLLAKQLEVLP